MNKVMVAVAALQQALLEDNIGELRVLLQNLGVPPHNVSIQVKTRDGLHEAVGQGATAEAAIEDLLQGAASARDRVETLASFVAKEVG